MDDHDTLNHRAFGALLGFSKEWRTELVSLLRSDAPISGVVRDELANAIEGETTFGTRLDLIGHDTLSKFFGRFADARESMAVGHYIAELVARKCTVESAFDNAAEKFGKSESECNRDYYYFKKCMKWCADEGKSGRLYSAMSQSELETVYHMALARKEQPLSGREWDLQRTALASEMTELIEPKLGASGWRCLCS